MGISFLNALAEAGQREAIADGLKAWVRSYYDDYNDATHVEPNLIAAWELLLEQQGYSYIDGDISDLIAEVQEAITSETGRTFDDVDGEGRG